MMARGTPKVPVFQVCELVQPGNNEPPWRCTGLCCFCWREREREINQKSRLSNVIKLMTSRTRVLWVKHGKTITNHPPVITILSLFIGGLTHLIKTGAPGSAFPDRPEGAGSSSEFPWLSRSQAWPGGRGDGICTLGIPS